MPLGLFDHEDEVPGIESVEIPSTGISRFLRSATKFLEDVDDALPGSASTWFRILGPG